MPQAIKVKNKNIVSDKAIPLLVSHINSLNEKGGIKEQKSELESNIKSLKENLLSKYRVPGVYQDKRTKTMILIGTKISVSKGWKDVAEKMRDFILIDLRTSESTREMLLEHYESLLRESVGVETSKREVFNYEEED